MFMIDYKDYGWWYWVAITTCVWVTMTINPDAYLWLVSIASIQLVHFRLVEGSVTRFPVQVRIAYLTYILLALPEGMQWILWLPAFGGLARVLFGYCLLARMLMLFPNNREQPLTWKFAAEAFFTPPVRGSILHGLPSVKMA